ncbi:hypothetical protein Tco_1229882 [Tanacetum coccineum]
MLCVSYPPLQIALVHLLAARDHEIQTLSVELQFESRVARSLLAEKETEIQGMRDTQSEPQEGKEVPILHEFHIGSNYLDIEFDEFFPLSLVDPKTVALCPWYPNRDCRDNDCGVALVVFNLARGYFCFKLDERLKALRIGKTTSILALANELLGPNYKEAFLELNASDDSMVMGNSRAGVSPIL